tara:strand:+ start:1293 stop:1565 length:273 start_codon:yes stop_codon:yes gene_type:complete
LIQRYEGTGWVSNISVIVRCPRSERNENRTQFREISRGATIELAASLTKVVSLSPVLDNLFDGSYACDLFIGKAFVPKATVEILDEPVFP